MPPPIIMAHDAEVAGLWAVKKSRGKRCNVPPARDYRQCGDRQLRLAVLFEAQPNNTPGVVLITPHRANSVAVKLPNRILRIHDYVSFFARKGKRVVQMRRENGQIWPVS